VKSPEEEENIKTDMKGVKKEEVLKEDIKEEIKNKAKEEVKMSVISKIGQIIIKVAKKENHIREKKENTRLGIEDVTGVHIHPAKKLHIPKTDIGTQKDKDLEAKEEREECLLLGSDQILQRLGIYIEVR